VQSVVLESSVKPSLGCFLTTDLGCTTVQSETSNFKVFVEFLLAFENLNQTVG